MSKIKTISLNVDDIGVSKLHRIKIRHCPKRLKDWIRNGFDRLDSKRIKKIQELAKEYGLPITWAVVPYYLDIYSWKKIRFDEALPGMHNLIKEYVKQGDEVIQHGNCHFFPDRNILNNEEFCTKNKRLGLEKQKELLESGWQALVKMGLRPEKIIQFPAWKADDNSIRALSQLNYKAVLAKNFLRPQKIFQSREIKGIKILTSKQTKLDEIDISAIFQNNEPLNLVMHPSQKNEFNNLKILLNLSKEKKIRFVKVSEMFKVSRR